MKEQKRSLFSSIGRSPPVRITLLDNLAPMTAEELAKLEAFNREWPDRMMKNTTPQQRARISQLARRKKNPADEQLVKKVANEERATQKHGYLKRTRAKLADLGFPISERRISQIITNTAKKKTRK